MPKRIALVGLAAVVAALTVASGPARAEAACDSAAIAGYFRAGDLDRLLSNREAAKTACQSDRPVFCSGRLAAVLYRNKAMRDANNNVGFDALAGTLEKGRALGQPWQVMAFLGELYLAQGQDVREEQAKSAPNKAVLPANPVADELFQKASDAYEAAINDIIDDKGSCAAFGDPGAPPVAQIAKLKTAMQEAKLLAPKFKIASSRTVECGGVFGLKEIRGFEAEPVPVPIEFDFDQATLTPKGAEAADGMAKCVVLGNARRIVLSGHTDLRGTQDYNLNLSARRLETVKNFLVAHGYHGTIVLQPKGKAEPFVPSTGSKYQPADLDRMNRRVVLKDTAP